MISVIVPAYNEAENISKITKEAITFFEDCEFPYEIIIVDDGSTDNTYEKAVSISQEYPGVKACGYRSNSGKGYALKYGFQFAHGDYILFLDADSELAPSQIRLFLELMKVRDADIVVGTKRHPLAKVNLPLSRRILSKGYSLLVKVLFNLNITDPLVGIKLFRKEVLDQVFPKVLVRRYAFDTELLANAARSGYSIVEAPVELNFHNNSGIDFKGICHIFTDTLAAFYRVRILRNYNKNKQVKDE